MIDWPIGISTGCFYEKSIFDCLEAIMSNGFSILEISSALQHLNYHDRGMVQSVAKTIKELGMEAYSFHAPFSDDIDIAALDEAHYERSVNEIMLAIEAASILNTRYFLLHPGPSRESRQAENEYYQRMTRVSEAIKKMARQCKKLGMLLILENMLPHLLFSSPKDILWIIGSVEETNIGICLDTGHAFLSDELYAIAHKFAGHTQLIHAHDNYGKHDDHLPPGKGRIDWKYFLREAAESGFNGGLIIELNKGDKSTEKILEEARHSRALMREILREIELTLPPISGE
ncbi:MAG: sugar phosphate isomerase/epimerase family protein [Candidatus Omnitrophota bacterium]